MSKLPGSKPKHTPGPWTHNKHPYALSGPQVETVLAPVKGEDRYQEVCIIQAHRNMYLDPRTKEEAEAEGQKS